MIGLGIDPCRIEIIERNEETARVLYHGVEFEVRAWSELVICDCSSGRIEERRYRQDADREDMAMDIAGQITARLGIRLDAGREARHD